MKKKLKISFNSPVVLWFVIICVVAMIANIITLGRSYQMLFMTYHSSLLSPLTYVRFITHVFGHADWGHLVGNMSYILLLGPMLEEKHGAARMVEVIVVTAFVTGIINYFVFPNVALCGASGVVFAFILLASFTRFRDGEIPLTVILVAILYIGQQVYDGILIQDNISNMAHIIGGVGGCVIGFCLNKKSKYRL